MGAKDSVTHEYMKQPEPDLKEVLKFIKHSTDKNKLRKLLDEDEKYQKLDRLAAQTISACSGVDFNIPVGEEEL